MNLLDNFCHYVLDGIPLTKIDLFPYKPKRGQIQRFSGIKPNLWVVIWKKENDVHKLSIPT